jgi:hypothetical protein
MDFFETIAYDNPTKAIAILQQHTRHIPETQGEIASGLKAVLRNLNDERKDEFLKELTEIHPDYWLFKESIESDYDDERQAPIEKASACGCMAGANGQQGVQSYMATGDAQTIMSQYQDKLNKLENEQTTNKTVNDKVFKLVVLGIIVILAYKILLKK